MTEVKPEARAALVVGLAGKLVDVPWEPERVTPVVHDYLLGIVQQAGGQAAAAFLFGMGDGLSFLRDAYQLSALQRLGPDGLRLVVREAWKKANGKDAPDEQGYQDFKIEVVLGMLQRLLP